MIVELNAEHKMDAEIAAILNQEGFIAALGCAFKGKNVWVLRTRWGIPTVKINGMAVPRRSGWKAASIKVREFRWARDVGRA
ncbi:MULTISPECIES: hypothetical protein [Bradyrhizobium]|uniref:hypothetical protein n=1 Tax=Bradyrhizobium TaxID=374 RepID=UPI000F807C5A|nr:MULTISPECIES: hypothetical protein [Bradyrhizobium]RTE87869.1 hypothetical protein D6B98_39530 [Bradyrhizobium sp. LVM 105]